MEFGTRRPKLNLAALLNEQNPRIDLRLEDYERRTREFSQHLHSYAEEAAKAITKRQDDFAAARKRAAEKAQKYEEQTNEAKAQELELATELQREKQERTEAESAVGQLRRQYEKQQERCKSLDEEISKLRLRAQDLKREKQRDRTVLTKHFKSLQHELQALQKILRCQCEGVGPESLLFRFWSVDPSDDEREFSFALDLGGDTYKVIASRPVLPSMTTLVDELNETKDVYSFIVKVRLAFADSVTSDS